MIRLPWDRGLPAVWKFVESLLEQHHIDILRLLKRGDGGGSRRSFGAGDSDAYNISQQFERYVRLTAVCHHGTTAVAAVVQQYNDPGGYADTTEQVGYPEVDIGPLGAITVNGFFQAGVHFADEYATVRFNIPNRQWYVLEPGRTMVWGTLGGALANGGSQTVNLARGGSVVGFEVLGTTSSITSGKKVWLGWNKDTEQWEVVSAQC